MALIAFAMQQRHCVSCRDIIIDDAQNVVTIVKRKVPVIFAN